MDMKRFDRVLNIALVVAVVLFFADYFFMREPPASIDETKNSAFAPVQLGKVEHGAPQLAVDTQATPQPAANVAAASTPKAEPFSALTWEQMETAIAGPTPTMMVIFTSWCPFCKKLIPQIISLASEMPGEVNIVAISIDEDPSAIRQYIGSLPELPPFTVYNHASDNERSLVQAFLFKNKMNFNGGIPFIAVFKDGQPVQQIGGFVEKSVLTDLLGRIKQQKNVNNAPT